MHGAWLLNRPKIDKRFVGRQHETPLSSSFRPAMVIAARSYGHPRRERTRLGANHCSVLPPPELVGGAQRNDDTCRHVQGTSTLDPAAFKNLWLHWNDARRKARPDLNAPLAPVWIPRTYCWLRANVTPVRIASCCQNLKRPTERQVADRGPALKSTPFASEPFPVHHLPPPTGADSISRRGRSAAGRISKATRRASNSTEVLTLPL